MKREREIGPFIICIQVSEFLAFRAPGEIAREVAFADGVGASLNRYGLSEIAFRGIKDGHPVKNICQIRRMFGPQRFLQVDPRTLQLALGSPQLSQAHEYTAQQARHERHRLGRAAAPGARHPARSLRRRAGADHAAARAVPPHHDAIRRHPSPGRRTGLACSPACCRRRCPAHPGSAMRRRPSSRRPGWWSCR